MICFSSDDFDRAWRYAVSEEFKDLNGNDFQYAEDGKKQWDDEFKRLDFGQSPTTAAISSDHKVFAVAVAREIHLFDENFSPVRVLTGHTADVNALAFHPLNSNFLVSNSSSEPRTERSESMIVHWDLRTNEQPIHELTSNEIANICNSVADTALERLQSSSATLRVASFERDRIASALRGPLESVIARSNVSENLQLHGRLQTGFQSSVFSPSGQFLIYLPGEPPRSHRHDQWDLQIFSTQEKADLFKLSGHRDSIMWCGYDAAEKFIGTAAWDETFKIWDARNGKIIYTFHTTGQNWTGGFSPDSKLFAGTCGGDASVHIYSLVDGSEFWTYRLTGHHWIRALSWSPSSEFLAIASQGTESLILLNVEGKREVQRKCLSDAKVVVEDERHRPFMLGFIETTRVAFAQSGRKIVYFISGDGSAEVLDLVDCRKWRFARAGTESYELADTAGNEKVTSSSSGWTMIAWENHESSCIMIATIDGDAIRIWQVKYDNEGAKSQEQLHHYSHYRL